MIFRRRPRTPAPIRLAHCEIAWIEGGATTRFPDGTHWEAYPHATPHYHVIAHRLGYGDDLLAYCREHEVMHALCAEVLLDAPSTVLWKLAHGETIEPAAAVIEEALVMTAQRHLRANERPIIGGMD